MGPGPVPRGEWRGVCPLAPTSSKGLPPASRLEEADGPGQGRPDRGHEGSVLHCLHLQPPSQGSARQCWVLLSSDKNGSVPRTWNQGGCLSLRETSPSCVSFANTRATNTIGRSKNKDKDQVGPQNSCVTLGESRSLSFLRNKTRALPALQRKDPIRQTCGTKADRHGEAGPGQVHSDTTGSPPTHLRWSSHHHSVSLWAGEGLALGSWAPLGVSKCRVKVSQTSMSFLSLPAWASSVWGALRPSPCPSHTGGANIRMLEERMLCRRTGQREGKARFGFSTSFLSLPPWPPFVRWPVVTVPDQQLVALGKKEPRWPGPHFGKDGVGLGVVLVWDPQWCSKSPTTSCSPGVGKQHGSA